MDADYKERDGSILCSLQDGKPKPFALLYRPDANGKNKVDVLRGDISFADRISQIALSGGDKKHDDTCPEKLVLIPYRQIAERGFDATDDATPLVVMDITHHEIKSVEEVVASIPSCDLELKNAGFDIDDRSYESIVESILKNEIGQGKGASFVIKRSYVADIVGYSVQVLMSVFKRLLMQENGAYWTFMIYTGERTLIGATPERHVTLDDGVATMNPISGTYRYSASGPSLNELTEFLQDKKEIDELYIVVDEELKMMSKACDKGVWLEGPKLKEMARLAHTEYFIHGKSTLSPLEILKETMFAPTVMGGPLESAASVIHQYEPGGRGYYSGVVALIGKKDDKHVLDSSILIRTADIDSEGKLRIAVGATLVRGSNPADETAETRTKLSGVLSAFGASGTGRLGNHPVVADLLSRRNNGVADFWLNQPAIEYGDQKPLFGKRILIVDAEDTFTWMIDKQLQSLGCVTRVRRYDEDYSFDENYDIVIMGPGPGDPGDVNHPKISHLRKAIEDLFERDQPFLCICLSHQVLCSLMGLSLQRRDDPNQGVQKVISLFGKKEHVGFYNTFSARSNENIIVNPLTKGLVEISHDQSTNEVHAIRGRKFCGIQFHAESILTIDGPRIFEDALTRICKGEDALINSPYLSEAIGRRNVHRDNIGMLSMSAPGNDDRAQPALTPMV